MRQEIPYKGCMHVPHFENFLQFFCSLYLSVLILERERERKAPEKNPRITGDQRRELSHMEHKHETWFSFLHSQWREAQHANHLRHWCYPD